MTKQKNYSWIVILAVVVLLAAVLYVAFQDITPVTHHVEQAVEINLQK